MAVPSSRMKEAFIGQTDLPLSEEGLSEAKGGWPGPGKVFPSNVSLERPVEGGPNGRGGCPGS
jgi:hypothetical protein